MAISNTARPSARGLRSAFTNATNGIREQWADFKDRHRSVQFLSDKASSLGKAVHTKAKHFGADFIAGYHAFQASYKDRHLTDYLEQCKADLEAEGFAVSAESDRAQMFSDVWEERRAAAEAEVAPEEPLDGPSASGMAQDARIYAENGIQGAITDLLATLQEYANAPEDQRDATAFAESLRRIGDSLLQSRQEEAPGPADGRPSPSEPSRDAERDAELLTRGIEQGDGPEAQAEAG